MSEETGYPVASEQEHERLASMAAKLGFTDVVLLERDVSSPLIYARWKGAPVALSMRSGLAGGFSCAFYKGPQPVEFDEDGDELPGDAWDEVADTMFGDPETALVMGAALLKEYSRGRENLYQDVVNVLDGERNPKDEIGVLLYE